MQKEVLKHLIHRIVNFDTKIELIIIPKTNEY